MSKAASVAFLALGAGAAYIWLPGDDRTSRLSEQVAQVTQIIANGGTAPALMLLKPPATEYNSSAPAVADSAPPRVFSASRPLIVSGVAPTPALEPHAPPAKRAGQLPAVSSFVAPAPMAQSDVSQRRLSSSRPLDDESRKELARDLQRELKRVGCYDGELNGNWGAPTKKAMAAFVDRVNATLPLEEPDYILLTLVQGHAAQACGKACPAGQGLNAEGKCLPRAILSQKTKRIGSEGASARLEQEATVVAGSAPVLTSPPTVAKRQSSWSTVVAVTPPPAAPLPPASSVAPRIVAPLPGRMAIGAAMGSPVAGEIDLGSGEAARRKTEFGAAAQVQRPSEVDAQRDRRALEVRRQVDGARVARGDTAAPAVPEIGPGTGVPSRLSTLGAKDKRRLAAIEQPRELATQPAAAPSIVVTAPQARLAPSAYVVARPPAPPAARTIYTPERNRWTRNVFSDLKSGR